MKAGVDKPQAARPDIHTWLEDRLEIDALWRALFLRKIPFGVNWLYTLGFASIAVFAILAFTGTLLAMYYAPTPDHAYQTVEYLTFDVPYGFVIRGIHHWAASAMVVLVVAHLLVVVATGAYKYPREATWGVGVVMLLLTLGSSFTGYLLPWDEKAYWATTVGTNMAGTIPFAGGFIVRVLRGGAELGALTLTRFYAAHMLLLPMGLVALGAVHLFMVIRQGVSVPPSIWDAKRAILARFNGQQSNGKVDSSRPQEYHHLYGRFKTLGRPFFPDTIFEDTVVTLLVTLVIVALAVLVGAPLGEEADPTSTSFIPRPEWYFMSLFELLKYFPGEIEWVGAMALPGALIAVLFALPWLDRGVARAPQYRRVTIGVTAAVMVAIVALTIRAFALTPAASETMIKLTPDERVGRGLVRAQSCNTCHVIKGRGSDKGPSLDGIAMRQDAEYITAYIENPKAVFKPTDEKKEPEMEGYSPPLTRGQVELMTKYLMTLPAGDEPAKEQGKEPAKEQAQEQGSGRK